ncbi:protein-tyrosine kinase [Vibrio proteolyticus]|uniref:AAA domain-containing protein n=1 Tax=Vibrio proteolyticus NBRC 13287 TaxID=1219065 RepID=U3B674_VIBPR|nr:protein-tyrosine kinase [Vibrio proteolyticus]GAD65334.1 putative protein-tyrosine kinase [Vibrio proteolyticus NBRC 13287]
MTIPATHSEIEQIYLAAELSQCRSLCLTACHSGDGVTSVATALTERFLLAGHKTLLVDLNLFRPGLDKFDLPIQDENWIEYKPTGKVFTGLPVPREQTQLLAYKDPEQLRKSVNNWLSQYDRVIVDTSPILQVNRHNIPVQSVASACDKTLLVVKAGTTTSAALTQAKELLTSEQISILGCVLNTVEQPTLAEELVRELNRCVFIPKSCRQRLAGKIADITLLSKSL